MTITDIPTNAQLEIIDAATTGIISYGSGVTVTDQSVTASYLNTLDGNTTGTVNASAVTMITGTASEIKTVYASSGISGLGNEEITLSPPGSAAAADLNTINAATTALVTATKYNRDYRHSIRTVSYTHLTLPTKAKV